MPVLQVYFPTKGEIEKLKKEATTKGFDSAASYIRELIKQETARREGRG